LQSVSRLEPRIREPRQSPVDPCTEKWSLGPRKARSLKFTGQSIKGKKIYVGRTLKTGNVGPYIPHSIWKSTDQRVQELSRVRDRTTSCEFVQPLWKTVWRLLKKLKIELPYDPGILFLGIYQKECKSGYNKGTCMPMFIEALFTIAKLWK
jgi:hypothetical protein